MLLFLFFYTKNWPWEAKTATVAKLRGRFCSFFFLGGQNRNFVKVWRRKLLLSLEFLMNCIVYYRNEIDLFVTLL